LVGLMTDDTNTLKMHYVIILIYFQVHVLVVSLCLIVEINFHFVLQITMYMTCRNIMIMFHCSGIMTSAA
jgi:hypothetical protein